MPTRATSSDPHNQVKSKMADPKRTAAKERSVVPKTRCNSCASDIPTEAIKCVKCGSFQNWRRHLDLGNTSLTAIIALLSVIGLAAPPIAQAIAVAFPSFQSVSLVSKVLDLDGQRGTISVANTGGKPVVISSLHCDIYPPKAKVSFQTSPDIDGFQWLRGRDVGNLRTYIFRGKPTIMQPNELQLMSFEFSHFGRWENNPRMTVKADELAKGKCEILFDTNDGGQYAVEATMSPLQTMAFHLPPTEDDEKDRAPFHKNKRTPD